MALRRGVNSVIAVTAHYIDDEWHLNTVLLGAIPNPTQQTGPEIAAAIQPRLDATLAPQTLVAVVVTDGGSNYVRAGKLLGGDPFRCSAHLLALAVHDVTEKQVNTSRAAKELNHMQVSRCKQAQLLVLLFSYVSFYYHYQQLLVQIAHSSELSHALRQAQTAAGAVVHEVILWNDTRWLGEYYALE